MSLKLAIAGKGGVGKTSLSAALAQSLARSGQRVLAVDADPNNCLGRALGLPEELMEGITPLSEMTDLLSERAGGARSGFFSLNPEVEDLLARFRVEHDGVSLLVMGTVDEPGAGCVCPESAVLKALMRHLVELPEYAIIMDMEAGLEHLGRGTAAHIGGLLIVVEPTAASARTALRIARLAQGFKLKLPGVVLNKATSEAAREKVLPYLDDLDLVATLPADPSIATSEAIPTTGPYAEAVEELRGKLESMLGE